MSPASIALSAQREAEYEACASDNVIPCLCGHDPAVAKDEDNEGTFYEVECNENRCHDLDMRVSARTLADAATAWVELVGSVERKMDDGLERQREELGCLYERRSA